MADDDVMPPDSGTSISVLRTIDARPAPAPNFQPQIEGMIKKVGEIGEAKEAALEPLRVAQNDRINKGVTELHKKYAGIEPLDVQPWTQKPPEWNPIQEFGSAASIFAQIAAAFTNRPATNALKAGAAALRAQRSNDLQSYDMAYDAWKKNTDLAINRHKMMMEDYKLASDLLTTDIAAGNAAMQAIGAKYGDEQTTLLAQAGLYDKLGQLWNARDQSALRWASAIPGINKENLHIQFLQAHPDYKSGTPQGIAKAEQEWQEMTSGAALRMTPDQMAMRKFLEENPNATAQDIVKFRQELYRPGGLSGSPDAIALRKFIEDNPDATAEDIAKFRQSLYRPSGAGNTMSAERAEAVRAKLDEIRAKEGREPTAAERANAIKSVYGSGMTGNRIDQLQSRVDQFDDSMVKIDGAVNVLENYVGAAGLAGRATRVKERLENVLGKNGTDRVQFMRDIEYLQLMAPQLLMDRNGRPLGVEAGKIGDLIAGLNIGDTTENTIRALTEIKALYAKMRADTKMRLSGDWKPSEEREGGTPGAPAAAPRTRRSWSDAPLVGSP